ncbi:hypothetical protein FGM00_15510 [Aggregatimonas sangjinii]|uniref:Uncharacterized protein n=1 Tax=Aggregatimonas sangjinii TaxID=2583587 RepID=A0A5B7SRX3_9FLAO|nr:hypothetical protein [Aggregatimonas sangjinii]QCX01445.1 hypothetical protein FGM00_15510 [Aggregatimonas sangjinii]
MKNLIFTTIIFFSFPIFQNLNAQSKVISQKKNQIENRKELNAKNYYSLSDKQYSNLMNLKDKKEITLKDGSLGYIIGIEEIVVAGFLTREQLDQLRQVTCLVPLAPGAPCGGDNECRSCPEGYICTSITRPRISFDLEHIDQNDLPTITEKGESARGNIAIIRPVIKKCTALPSNLRN